MVARVLFLWLTSCSIPHSGRPSRPTQPLIHHPRPYGSPGLSPDFPSELDGYWLTLAVNLGGEWGHTSASRVTRAHPCTLAINLGGGWNHTATCLKLVRMGDPCGQYISNTQISPKLVAQCS